MTTKPKITHPQVSISKIRNVYAILMQALKGFDAGTYANDIGGDGVPAHLRVYCGTLTPFERSRADSVCTQWSMRENEQYAYFIDDAGEPGEYVLCRARKVD